MSVDEFRAQFAQEAGLESPTPAEPADTVIEEERPEGEEQEQELEPGVAEPETEEVEEPDDVANYLAKYGGDVDEALKAAVEAQKVIGRQGAEVGELRKVAQQVDELRALVEAQNEPQYEEPPPQYDPGSIDEYLAENPQHIPALARQAIDAGDGFLYQRALAAWGELDQVGAMDFHARAVSDAAIERLREEMAPAVQSAQRAETTNQFAAAYETVASRHEDFAMVMNAITDETIAGFPKSVIGALQTGDQATKQEVLETLYRWTKTEQAGSLSQAASAAVAQTQQDSRAARQNAAVASTTTSQGREVKSNLDAFHEQFQASDAFRKAAGLA